MKNHDTKLSQSLPAYTQCSGTNGRPVLMPSGIAPSLILVAKIENGLNICWLAIRFVLFLFLFFTVTAAFAQPGITALSPGFGAPGSSVTISGSGFNTTPANNIVYFGATKATVSSASSTALSVFVPPGATYNNVLVTNTASSLMGMSEYSFLPTFNNSAYVPGVINFDNNVNFGLPAGSAFPEIGDIDGDGKPDLVFASQGGNSVFVYRNISTTGAITRGSFAAPVRFIIGGGLCNVKIADLDGDGKLDLVVANQGANTVSVLRNTAAIGIIDSGSFAPHVDFSVGWNPTDVAICDINGDGKPDVIATNRSANTISVLQNIGAVGSITSASFAAHVDFPTDSWPYSIVAADIDGDGKPDIAVANYGSNTISVYRNTATTGLINTASFAPRVNFATGTRPYSLAIGDLDGDGKPDMVVANALSGTVSVLHNTAASGTINGTSFAAKVDFTAGSYTNCVAIGDLDGDGKPDIGAVSYYSGTLSIYRNSCISGIIDSSSFASKVDYAILALPYNMAIGDLDGDGKPEIVVATPSFFAVFRNDPLWPIASGTSVICAGTTTTFIDSTPHGTWSSSNTAIATVGPASGIITGVAAGSVAITYTVKGGSTTKNLTVNPLPTISAGSGVAKCTGASDTLTATGGLAYTWSIAGGLSCTTCSSPVATPTVTTTYTVTGTNVFGCTNTATVTLTVNPLPVISAGSGISICIGSSTAITATGGTVYSWMPATGLSATTGAIVTANPTAAINYTLTGTDANGCSNSSTKMVRVNPLPTISAGSGVAICAGASGSLTATGGLVYSWSPSAGLSCTACSNPAASPTVTTTYTVTGTNATTATFNFTGAVQSYTVPAGITNISITAAGAQGGNNSGSFGGNGAIMGGTFNVIPGHILDILVGGQPATVVDNSGGGGGSFVWDVTAGNVLLIAAGGGGGAGGNFMGGTVTINGIDAVTTGNGTNGGGGFNGAGTSGDGATAPTGTLLGACGAGGTGWLSNGAPGTIDSGYGCGQATGGTTALAGGMGGVHGGVSSYCGDGGFGGGGGGQGACYSTGSGGGGGYSGGAGGGYAPMILIANPGGGGGSYNIGFDQSNSVGNTGSGYAIITTVGCTNTATVTVTVNPLPAPVTVSGRGVACGNAAITATGGSGGTIYFEDTVSGGTSALVPSSSQSITSSGIYYFRSQSSLGCWGTQGSASVTINPLPVAYTVTGGGAYCSGITSVPVGLSGSQSGIKYQLFRGATALSIVTGTGSAISFGAQTIGGTYTVVATNSSTSCSNNMNGSVVVTVGIFPAIVSVTGGGGYCASGTGVNVGIAGSAIGIDYQLYKGSTPIGSPAAGLGYGFSFGHQMAAGTYTVTATEASSGCTRSMSGSATVYVYSLPVVYAVTGGGSYCTGGYGVHIGISGSNTGISYRLYNSGTPVGGAVAGTGSAINFGLYTAAGTYTVIATASVTGCTCAMSGSAIVVIDPLPAVTGTTYTVSPGSTIALTGTPSGGTWFSSNISVAIVGSGTGNVTGVTLGTDVITYTTPAGCAGTHFIYVTSTGHKRSDENAAPANTDGNMYVMPNPNKGTFTLKGQLNTTRDQEVTIYMVSMTGQIIYTNKIMAHDGAINELVNIDGKIANGMYQLALRSANENKSIPVVIQQ